MDSAKVIGIKFSGQSSYKLPEGGKISEWSKDSSASIPDQIMSGLRYDYVLTAFQKTVWDQFDHLEIINDAAVRVDPKDGVDPSTELNCRKKFNWNKPVFDLGGSGLGFGGFVRADGWYRYASERELTRTFLTNIGMVAGFYIRYDLNELVGEDRTVDSLNNLDYAVWMEGYPLRWTVVKDATAAERLNPENYFKTPVRYVLTNDDFYIYDEQNTLADKVQLDPSDYQIDTLAFDFYVYDRGYNSDTAAFDRKLSNCRIRYEGRKAFLY